MGSGAVVWPDSLVLHTCPQARCGYTFYSFFCVCTVTDFYAENNPSGVKFCMAVHRRPGQGNSHFGELCSPEAQNGMYVGVQFIWGLDH